MGFPGWADTTGVSPYSCCRDKASDTRRFGKEGVNFRSSLEGHGGGGGGSLAAGVWGGGSRGIRSREVERDGRWRPARFLLCIHSL